MKKVECINIQDAKRILEKEEALLVDIREVEDYNESSDPFSYHLTGDNFQLFLQSTPKDRSVIVMCYHGNSSKQVAQTLINEGFEKIYSLDGGYEEWKKGM